MGHGWLELHGNSCIPVFAILIAARSLGPVPAEEPIAHAALFGFGLCAAATNQFHMWAHKQQPAPVVAWLQRHALILSPERHALHHEGGYCQSFCMTTGWLNPLLDRLEFFPRLERAIRTLRPPR